MQTEMDKAAGIVGKARDQQAVDIRETDKDAAEQIDGVDKAITARPANNREFSFLHKNPDSFDTVEVGKTTYTVPAQAGSTYWAILKVMYAHADKRVYCDTLCDGVAELMTDRDEDGWNAYCNKEQTTVYHKQEKKRSVKPIKSWQDRIIGNAKTLTRVGGSSPYGKRLVEKGHCMRFGHDADGKPYFILHTNLDPIKKKIEKNEKHEDN